MTFWNIVYQIVIIEEKKNTFQNPLFVFLFAFSVKLRVSKLLGISYFLKFLSKKYWFEYKTYYL